MALGNEEGVSACEGGGGGELWHSGMKKEGGK